ncbi:hypothetical protein FALBO_11046 [Fusarium albosuccineum]|uniref:Uncharacterized protein n=1 Tax=Fusarium albosuccineum TaxID=1237068 RepID=A0A8H4P7J3_9HYPO|nr:hypothetical protein FALBO_11046 [Fusarium albosuccineum]
MPEPEESAEPPTPRAGRHTDAMSASLASTSSPISLANMSYCHRNPSLIRPFLHMKKKTTISRILGFPLVVILPMTLSLPQSAPGETPSQGKVERPHVLNASLECIITAPIVFVNPRLVRDPLSWFDTSADYFTPAAYPTTACYGCAKVGRTCRQVPDNAKPHARILQEAAKLLGRGQPVRNWDQLARCALTAVQQVERDSSSMPDPPKAIQRDPGLSPHVPQPPGHDLPHQAFSGNEVAALVTRNNELVAKTNQLLKDLLEKVSVPNNGGFLPPWG